MEEKEREGVVMGTNVLMELIILIEIDTWNYYHPSISIIIRFIGLFSSYIIVLDWAIYSSLCLIWWKN